MAKLLLILCALLVGAADASAQDPSPVLSAVASAKAEALAKEDWPEFRGPGGQGHSAERGLPLEWSEGKNVAWKTPVPGLGWSSPVVAGGRVWMTTADRAARHLACARWRSTSRPGAKSSTSKSSTSRRTAARSIRRTAGRRRRRSIDGDRVYVHFGADGTAALSTTGEILWKARFDYQSQHGAGGSPIVYGDLLIFNCDGSDVAFVIALDKHTGKVKWKTNRGFPADQAYTTPLVIRVGDRDQLISVGAFRARAYDPLTGKEIWRVRYDEGFSNVPRPVFAHGLVLHRHRVSAAGAAGGSSRWDGRCDQDSRRVVAEARRAAHAVATHRRR